MASSEDGSRSARLSLEPVPASAARAREFVQAHARLWDCDDPDEIVALLTTETVANAVAHAAAPIALTLLWGSGAIRVETEDGSPELPELRAPAWDDPRGRGLMLVDALARSWGAERRGPGKVVWFEYGPC
ncbi:MAG: ATP-binding protein [Acidimicrobiales bacterium]